MCLGWCLCFLWCSFETNIRISYINKHTSERVLQCNTVHIVHTVAIGTVYCVLRSALCTAHCAICWTGCVAIGHHVNSASTEIYPCSVLPGQNPNLLQISNCKFTSLQTVQCKKLSRFRQERRMQLQRGSYMVVCCPLNLLQLLALAKKTRPSCLC